MLNFNIYVAFFFESVSVFMMIFFFIQYFILRKREYLFYALYLLAISVYYLIAIPDLFFDWNLEEKAVKLLQVFKRPVQFFTSIFYTYFIIDYLGITAKNKNLYNFLRILILIYFILAGTFFIGNLLNIDYNNIFYVVNLLLLPAQVYIISALFKEKIRYANYIILGTLIILIGSLITLLISINGNRLGIQSLSQSIRVFLPVQICILADIVLFSIALQKKVADTEKSLVGAAFHRQQAINLERERIISDLHDDVGGGLSSIRMMSDLMAKPGSSVNLDKTASFAQKISLTAKDIAQRMHTIIWSLNTEHDTLENFIEYVRQYGISFFENSGIDFQAVVDSPIPPDLQVKGVDRKNLFLISKEAFHNILKHAHATSTSLHITLAGKKLQIQIKDNGAGISETNPFGNGLKNMKKRIEELGGELQITMNGGTAILIKIELNR